MKNSVTEKNTKINYGSESVNITLECCNYLLENCFYENQEEDNIKLLENCLVNYSILKMVDWGIDIDQVGIENWNNLKAILEILNNQIATQEDKSGFFAQYTQCIIYIYSIIKQQPCIKWIRIKDSIFNYVWISEDEQNEVLITSQMTPAYEIPLNLLEKIKSDYPIKKNPVLEK